MFNTIDMMYMDDITRENNFDFMLDCLADDYDSGLREVNGETLLNLYQIELPLSNKEFAALERLVGRLPDFVLHFENDPRI